jgi:hypothetical protein
MGAPRLFYARAGAGATPERFTSRGRQTTGWRQWLQRRRLALHTEWESKGRMWDNPGNLTRRVSCHYTSIKKPLAAEQRQMEI